MKFPALRRWVTNIYPVAHPYQLRCHTRRLAYVCAKIIGRLRSAIKVVGRPRRGRTAARGTV
jgi:hypothetical protein